jgi:hypothetical protein
MRPKSKFPDVNHDIAISHFFCSQSEAFIPLHLENLFAPSGESIGESTVPRLTFFEGKNGTPAIVVNDRNIKPRPVFE